MDAAYLRAAMPEPFTILGTKLEPFCLGHEIIFQRFKNKFSIESKDEPGIGDFLTGLFVCSRRYSKDTTLDGFKVPWRIRFSAWLFGHKRIAKAFLLFARYIQAHCEIPDFYTKESDTKTAVGTPTIQAVKVSLMANLGLSEEDALNTPIALAFWNHLSWMEAQGSIQIIDDKEREKIAQAKQFEAQVEAMRRRLNGS